MKRAEIRLREEHVRAKKFCDTSTYEKLLKVCIDQLIGRHLDRFYAEFKPMLELEKSDDIARMYRLVARVQNGMQPVLQTFQEHIVDVGMKLIEQLTSSSQKDPKSYVDCLIGLHRHYSKVVSVCFSDDPNCEAAMDKAFRSIVNSLKVSGRAAEMLAKYCDVLLRKGPRNSLTDAEIEEMMTQIVCFFAL